MQNNQTAAPESLLNSTNFIDHINNHSICAWVGIFEHNFCLGGLVIWTNHSSKVQMLWALPVGGRLRVPLKLWVDHATLHRERLSLSILRVNIFYYINGSVLQGFPFLGRAVTACNSFFVCLISPISAFCATLWGLRNEWQSVLRSGSNIVCQIVLSVKAFRVYMIN